MKKILVLVALLLLLTGCGEEKTNDTKPYITNTGLNGGCYPLSDKEKYCDSVYKLTNVKCIKEINATES